MDRREEIASIVRNNLGLGWSKTHYYPEIQNKVVAKLTKYFDPGINTNAIAVFIDTALSLNQKEGMVFTLQGIYYKAFLEKVYYFNYADIAEMTVIPDKKGRTDTNGSLDIRFQNGAKLTITNASFDVTTLKKTFALLISKSTLENQLSTKKSGVVSTDVAIPEDIKKKCHAIIHSAAVSAGAVGTGMAQIPLADNAVITPIQIAMIVSIGSVFEMRITESAAKGIIATCATSIAGRGLSQLLWGWIPGLGNAINTATATGITEAIGWVAVKHFYALQQDDAAKHRVTGMKAGYEAASAEYEAKLRKQADEFVKQMHHVDERMSEYNQLCDEYEKYIIELERKIDKTQDELEKLREMKRQYDELVGLAAKND